MNLSTEKVNEFEVVRNQGVWRANPVWHLNFLRSSQHFAHLPALLLAFSPPCHIIHPQVPQAQTLRAKGKNKGHILLASLLAQKM